MKKEEKISIDDHKKFMDQKVQHLLKPLMVDILKNRPDDVLAFIIDWCQSKGTQIQQAEEDSKDYVSNEPAEDVVATKQINQSLQEVKLYGSANVISSDEENDLIDEDSEEQKASLQKRISKKTKKMAISAEVYGAHNVQEVFVAPVIEKSEEQINKISKFLKVSFMFSSLDEKDQNIILNAMSVRNYQAGDVIIKQGDDGAELFIVGSGSLSCTKRFNGSVEETFLKNYAPGEVFGELSLMYNAPRAATIIATEDSVLFSLDRDTFNHIVKSSSVKNRENLELFLSKVEILSDLNSTEKIKLCDCLKKETFLKNDYIIREGEVGSHFYLIESGTANAIQTLPDGTDKVVFEFRDNDYFGELALINDDPRKASVVVTSDKMVVASLDNKSFKRLLGPIENILKRLSLIHI